jgi:hypothetical protein
MIDPEACFLSVQKLWFEKAILGKYCLLLKEAAVLR